MTPKRPVAADNRQILEEASAWFVDFRFGEIDDSERSQFMDWLRRSPEHIRAYMEISGAYARLPTPNSLEESDIESLIAHTRSRATVVPLDAGSETLVRLPVARDNRLGRPLARRRFLLAASIAILSACAGLASWLAFNRVPVYVTETGEQRSITLEDGSRIELNARSIIRVHLTPAERNIELLQGQALFQVAKDANRPFIVSSAGALVRAVGTRFDVYIRESGTTVTVLEGRVAVRPQSRETNPATLAAAAGNGTSQTPRILELSAGEQAVVTSTAISKPARANAAAATAWLEGQLEFDETRLEDVAEEFNRYNRRPLIVKSRALADFRISGIYSSAEPDSLIRFLRSQPRFIVTETDTEIRITEK